MTLILAAHTLLLTSLIASLVLLVLAIVLIMGLRKRNQALQQKSESSHDHEVNDMMVREIHHRIKNNFQTVSSLLNLQTRYLTDEAAKNVLWEGQNRIKSMALIHQQLYQRDSTTMIEMVHYIHKLVGELAYSYSAEDRGVEILSNVQKMDLHASVAVPLGLIIHEFVLNSFKYAFPDGRKGEVLISLSETPDNQLLLVIRDDGIGLPEGMEPLKVQTSYGMRLIILFAQELKGEVTYETDQGTVARLNFPKPRAQGLY